MSGFVRAETDLIQLKVRMKERLRAKIEAAAKERGNSLNGEVVRRLRESFGNDELRTLEHRVARLEAGRFGITELETLHELASMN